PARSNVVRVRPPPAKRLIRATPKDGPLAVPGVLAALTGADCLADGLKPIPHKPWSPHPAETPLSNRGGVPPFEAPHHPLPADKVRFAGEAVAVVVGETLHAAKDGAERLEIDYEGLPARGPTAAAGG